MTPLRADDIDLAAFLETLREWVEIETPTARGDLVNELASRVARRAAGQGLQVERRPGADGVGDLVIVRMPGPCAGPRVLILAHLDTVHPVGTLSGPLPWREDDEKIFGPGIYDMKSGALMALHALELLAARSDGQAPDVTLLVVPDEETGSAASRPAIEEAAANAEVVLVVEPARDGGQIVVARKGVALFDIVVRGRASHAGTRPLDGRSAIREAARLVLALEALNDPERGITVTVGTIAGGTARNVVPAECRMAVDVRVPNKNLEEEVLAAIHALAHSGGEVSVEISGGINRPAYAQSEGGKALFDRARTLAADLGLDLRGMSTGGGSDGNFTAAMGVPTLDGLGADGAGAHTHDEHILTGSLRERIALLANLCNSPQG